MRRVLFVAVAVVLLAGLAPAHAGTSYIAWPPGSTYANPTLSASVMQQGDTLMYANLDAGGHNIFSDTAGPDSNTWCGPIREGGPRRFPLGECPAFISATTGISQIVAVDGAPALAPGTYGFHCSPHPWMTGKLVVVQKTV